MRPTVLSRSRRMTALAFAGVLLIGTAAFDSSVHAQIQGIERGGGVDRPYVPPRRRLNNPRATVRVKDPKITPKTPENAAMIPISAEAMKLYDTGRSAYDKGNLDDALKDFEAAVRLESKYVDALIDLGDVYFDQANLDDAADTYKRALAVDKGNTDAQFRLGRVSYARRDYDTAVAQYNDVLKVRPTDPEAIYNIALSNKALKRYGDAIPFFEKAITARGRAFPEARINLSRCYYELAKYPEAEAEARKALDEIGADKPESANAWYALATALANQSNHLPDATEALKSAIGVCKACPSYQVSAYYRALGRVLESRGERTQAAEAYERYLEVAPFIPDYEKQDVQERISKLRKVS